MSTVLTASNAGLLRNSNRVGQCRDLTLALTQDILETTRLGDLSKKFIPSLKSATGSASIFYDPLDSDVVNIIEAILDEDFTTLDTLTIQYDTRTGKEVELDCIFTNTTIPVSFGEAVVVEVQFQVSDAPTSVRF